MDAVNGAQVVAVVLVVIAALASAVAFFKANYAKAQIVALRGDRDDQAARLERQDQELKEMRAELLAERTARQALEKVVTGRDLLEELRTELTHHHTAAMQGLSGVHNTMEQVVEVLEAVRVKVAA